MSSFSMNIVRLLLMLALLTATAQAAELSPQAQEPFRKGLIAAQQRDWKLAVHYFLNAQEADPDAPEIWFNLGLASSKLPGYEVRAIALFKAYLLANPGAPKAAAIRGQIAALEAGFESKMGKITDQLESLLMLRKAEPIEGFSPEVQQAHRRIAMCIGWDLASIRYFMGDTSGALRGLRATNGDKWQEDWRESWKNVQKRPYGSSAEEPLAVSMAAAGLLDEATSMLQQTYDQDAISFILEQGDVAHAQQLMNDRANDGWRTIACLAYYRNDNTMLGEALAKAKADINDLVASGTCEDGLWWSVGRIGFLLKSGTDGITIDTQLADYLQHEALDSLHPGEAVVFLNSAAANIAGLLREYRKIRGSASARDDYAEAYYYRGNVYYNKGQYDRAIRNYDQALRLQPDYAEAVNSRANARTEMTRLPTPDPAPASQVPNVSAAKGATLADEVLRHLTTLDDYRDLQALYDEKKAQTGWSAGDEGMAVAQRLKILRADAATTAIVGIKLHYTVRGQKVTDSGIIIADLKTDPEYRAFIVNAVAQNILADRMDAKVQAALDRFRVLRKYNASRLPPAATTMR